MARYSLTSMIFASALLAAPALAATTGTDATPAANSPATSSPATTGSAPATPPGATPGTSHAAGPAVGTHSTTAANQPAPPKFTTDDNQLRAGKLVGATVYNDKNQSVGSIDDILLSQDQSKAQTAIISVGGFLGMGSKLVSVPFEKLKIENDKVVMPGATQDALKQMPEYKFNNKA